MVWSGVNDNDPAERWLRSLIAQHMATPSAGVLSELKLGSVSRRNIGMFVIGGMAGMSKYIWITHPR